MWLPLYLPYHDSQPSDERPDGRLKDDGHADSYLHSHVVMAPTVPGLVEERERYGVYEKQISWLHQAGRDAMASIWERELGVDRYAELQAELVERDRYQRALDAEHERRELEAAFSVERVPEPTRDPERDRIDHERDIGWELGQ